MSNAVFPVLPGLTWNRTKNPQFQNKTQVATSGKQTRVAYWSFPIWSFVLVYEFLRDQGPTYDELNTIRDFFLSRQGSYDSFLYTDPDDNAVTGVGFGTGDGSTKAFQLIRPIKTNGFAEPIQNLNGAPSIYVNGVLQSSGYTVGTTGIVTFTTAPALGAVLTWTGSYYYRVHFKQDITQFNEFMYKLWELKQVELESIKL